MQIVLFQKPFLYAYLFRISLFSNHADSIAILMHFVHSHPPFVLIYLILVDISDLWKFHLQHRE